MGDQGLLFDAPVRARQAPTKLSGWDWWHEAHRQLDAYREQHPDTPGQWNRLTFDELGMEQP